jgi:hypothetical protein
VNVKRPDEFGRHQLHLVSHLRKLARPMLGSAAGFHPDRAGCTVREVLKKLRSFDRPVHDLASFLIHVVHLKHAFGDIDPYWRKLHVGRSGCLSRPTWSSIWTSKSVFTGPSLSDILKIVGAQGDAMELSTLDDYTIAIPLADAARYGVILAYSMNGKRLPISDFGPLFLIYPRDAHRDELSSAVATARFVWQINSLVVK